MEQQEMSPIRGLILTALGEASMAWSETPKGVFNDQEVTRLADTLEKAIGAQQDPACFTDAVRPAIKWLAEKHNPHTKAIVTATGAELLSGEETTGEITDYLRD